MRKIFEYIGLITLMCFSFFITEKTTLVVQNIDEIMINIRSYSKDYKTEAKNAKVFDNEIIPGICGKVVNEEKSYEEMKKIGMYDPTFFVYNYINPEISLVENKNKYIVAGNSDKNHVYIFAELTEVNKDLLSQYEFRNFNFIVNDDFYKKNLALVDKILKNNNSILLTKTNYKNYKKINKKYFNKVNNNIYCYNDTSDYEFLNTCSDSSNTIKINHVIMDNNLLNIKKVLKRGTFIKLNLNNLLIKNINSINNYVSAKGLELSNVDKTLKEC